MKLSLSWIFEHINGSWQSLILDTFIERFNNTIAEVDFHKSITFDFDTLAIGKVTKITDTVSFFIPEWNSECMLSLRKDAFFGGYFLIKKDKKQYRYASLSDFGSEKEGLLPALFIHENHLKGEWKSSCLSHDYMLLIDNKSLTHRPDLWGHRGIAREVAAMLDLELVPEEELLFQAIIKNYDKQTIPTATNPITVVDQVETMCDRIATVMLSEVEYRPSLPAVVQKLAIIDARAHNALIDVTNYVMYDVGQPMHAFDADMIAQQMLVVRKAHNGETVQLLDEETVKLHDSDCVIADPEKVLSLAGIMGGNESSIQKSTTKVLFESAHFSPTAIRRTALKYKKRTEASARFEKNLDPNQNTVALMRSLFLMQAWGIPHTQNREISSIGKPAVENAVVIPIQKISQKLGMAVQAQTIKKVMGKLGFGVQENHDTWTITVPTYRIHDITILEDIVEEIGRFIGYDNIPHRLPVREMKPLSHHSVMRIRELKRHCAFAYGMHELSLYPLFDEEFLRVLNWQPENAPTVSNPVSETWTRLVTSLVPHLLKAIQVNSSLQEALRFFEWGRVWQLSGSEIQEKKSLTCLWYNPKSLDFYEVKAHCASLFALIGASVLWQRAESPQSYFHPYQTAQLLVDGKIVGYAGKIAPHIMNVIGVGEAFVMELDGDFLISYKRPEFKGIALSKFPHTTLDISMFVPSSVAVAHIEQAISLADTRIKDLFLVDYYEKSDWQALRSVTIRYIVVDDFKTLTKQEIDEIAHSVAKRVMALGVTVR